MSFTIYNPVIRDTTTFIHTAAETAGRYTQVEVTLMPGGGTPLHFHRHYEESFRVTDGDLSLECNKQILTLAAGESYTVRAGACHRFFNTSGKPVRFEVMVAPGSTGFEQSLQILYGLAADGHTNAKGTPRKLSWLAVILVMSDINAPGLPALLTPLFRWYAATGKGKLVKRYLVSRYCRKTVRENTAS